MHLGWLELRAFRSYEELSFQPEPGVNILVGDNGAGKTNVLEAIGYLSALKSFRRSPDVALVRNGDDLAIVRGGFERASGELRIEVEIPASGRRRILVNAKRPRRHSDVANEVPLVAFLPDDLDLVKRGPALRREYVDDLGARLSPTVGANLTEYEKAVRQRNSLLRQDGRYADPLTLDAWDEQIAAAGALVLVDRLGVIDRLLPALVDAYGKLGGGGEIAVAYESSWAGAVHPADPPDHDQAAGRLLAVLGERRGRDMDQKTTTAGPHRDEPTLALDGRPTRSQASQGEQRSLALAMRLAAYRLLRDRHDTSPILSLDDVFSELDMTRASAVLELLPAGQVFVTTAREDEVPVEGRTWHVAEGSVE